VATVTPTAQVKEPEPGLRRQRRRPLLTDGLMATLFIAPSVILLLAISIFPLIWSVYLSFTRYRVTGIVAPVWIGLTNYRTILTNNDLYDDWHVFQVTAVIVVCAVTLEFLLASAWR
jgi:multiple sugar transport system permease protein